METNNKNKIKLTMEEAFCTRFSLNIEFEYNNKLYGATSDYIPYDKLRDIDIWEIDTDEILERLDIDDTTFQELLPIVRFYLERLEINDKTLTY
tara:strand:- start:2835 stop:3116 length:282 start_codon:yes stop_codon:yes gene_type:complete